jgi:tetratricopeptide (TPR) repeat protein
LAKLYQRFSQNDEARQVLEEGLRATGNDFDLQIALTEMELSTFRQNLRQTEERLRTTPDSGELRTQHARLRKEILTREMSLFRQRADRYPNELSPRLELGVRLLETKQVDEAIAELQQARRDTRLKGRALMYLGLCFRQKRNWPLAKRNFEEALDALAPNDEEARKEILFHLATGAADQADWPAALEHATELANLDYAYQGIGKLLDEWQQKQAAHPAS